MQEIGRAGRGGQNAQAILYFAKGDMVKEYFKEDIRLYTNNNTICRRKVIDQQFGSSYDGVVDDTSCCDVCEKTITSASPVTCESTSLSVCDPYGNLFGD